MQSRRKDSWESAKKGQKRRHEESMPAELLYWVKNVVDIMLM